MQSQRLMLSRDSAFFAFDIEKQTMDCQGFIYIKVESILLQRAARARKRRKERLDRMKPLIFQKLYHLGFLMHQMSRRLQGTGSMMILNSRRRDLRLEEIRYNESSCF